MFLVCNFVSVVIMDFIFFRKFVFVIFNFRCLGGRLDVWSVVNMLGIKLDCRIWWVEILMVMIMLICFLEKIIVW